MTDSPFDDAVRFYQPSIDLGPDPATERQRYSKPPLHWQALRFVAAGMVVASTLVFFRGAAAGTELRHAAPTPGPTIGDIGETMRRLDELKSAPALPGIEAPNVKAFTGAKRVLKVLGVGGGPLPERVVPDASGGISFLFFAGEPLPGGARPRYAALTSTNEGQITALTHDRVAGATETWLAQSTAAQKTALRRIQAFLDL